MPLKADISYLPSTLCCVMWLFKPRSISQLKVPCEIAAQLHKPKLNFSIMAVQFSDDVDWKIFQTPLVHCSQ